MSSNWELKGMLGSSRELNPEPHFLQSLHLKLSEESVQMPPAKFGDLRVGRTAKNQKFLFGPRTSPAPSAKRVETRSDTKSQVRICCPVNTKEWAGCSQCTKQCHRLETLDCTTPQSPF